jgi:hypothetical protein
MVVFALMATAAWAFVQNRNRETEVAIECPAIFGVEVPNSRTPEATFRHQKIEAATILHGLETQALANPGDAEANRQFEKAWRIWNSCFDPERLLAMPMFL